MIPGIVFIPERHLLVLRADKPFLLPEKVRVKDKMVVDETSWSTGAAAIDVPRPETELLEKLTEIEKVVKTKEIEENRKARQENVLLGEIKARKDVPQAKIGKNRQLSKKAKEKKKKAAEKAIQFVEQLESKASKSVERHVRPNSSFARPTA